MIIKNKKIKIKNLLFLKVYVLIQSNCVFDKILTTIERCILKCTNIKEDKFLRRKTAKHSAPVQSKSKNKVPFLKSISFKVLSFLIAFVLIGSALIVPATNLAPDVEAIANQKAIAFSVGGLNEYSDVILNNCKHEESTEPVTEVVTEPATEPTTAPVTEEVTEPTTEPATEETTVYVEETTEATESTEETYEDIIIEDVVDTEVPSGDYLLSIKNPDPNYSTKTVTLSAKDRDLLERLVMGEAGGMGFTGCALVAQTIKDTMFYEGVNSVSTIISKYAYTGSTKVKPNQAVKDAVSYIFDSNGSAVQHRLIYFYQSSYCTSKWHETQNFVVSYGGVRFFDRW